MEIFVRYLSLSNFTRSLIEYHDQDCRMFGSSSNFFVDSVNILKRGRDWALKEWRSLPLLANCRSIAEAVEYGILKSLATSLIEYLGLVKSSVEPKYMETNSRFISGLWLI